MGRKQDNQKKQNRKIKKNSAKVQFRKNKLNFIELLLKKKYELINYKNELVKRKKEAFYVPLRCVSIGDWNPQPNLCHQNVFTITRNIPGYYAVHGWLYFDMIGKFVAHSVIKAPDGKYYDITPQMSTTQYPFITANLKKKEFYTIVKLTKGNLFE
ncbi:hypothetical protein [Legionella sp. WA2022007384]